MTASRVHVYFVCVQDLELALRRFESGGLSGIVELEGSIEATKQTHLLIQQAGLGVRDVVCEPPKRRWIVILLFNRAADHRCRVA